MLVKTLVRSGAVTLLAIGTLFTGSAQAIVIDFEDIGIVGGVVDLQGSSPYQDLNWNYTLDTVDIGDGTVSTPWSGTGPAYSGRQAALNNNGGSGVITGASGAFVFNDIWIKSWFSSGVGANGTISGTLSGSNVFSLDFIQSDTWQNISAGEALIDTLTISVGGSIFLIDDLQINSSSVPEPNTMALLTLGLAGLGFARRKKLAA